MLQMAELMSNKEFEALIGERPLIITEDLSTPGSHELLISMTVKARGKIVSRVFQALISETNQKQESIIFELFNEITL